VAKIPKAAYLSKVKITQLDSFPNNTALSIKEKPLMEGQRESKV